MKARIIIARIVIIVAVCYDLIDNNELFCSQQSLFMLGTAVNQNRKSRG
jgi:hypothetical protein